MLALGETITNYEPLLKKGWEIQRAIDGMSLKMESLSNKEVEFDRTKYLQLC